MDRKTSGAIALIASIIAIGLAWSGCSDPRRFWIGTWEGRRALPNESTMPDHVRATLSKVRLTIHGDETFELEQSGIPASGDASLRQDGATLRIKRLFDRAIEQSGEGTVKQNLPIELARKPDGTIAFSDPGGFLKEPVVLRRAQSKP